MDEAIKSQVFDPFFSTKFVGRGLGMAAVAGIVRSHDGAIFLDSELGQGTTVRVIFPAAERDEKKGTGPVIINHSVSAGKGTVLVVDDEEIVLRQAKLGLERHGYRVLLASSGPQAIETLQRNPQAIDIVLLDLSMPGMDGCETLDSLSRIKPGVKVIVSSGYGEPETMDRFGGRPIHGFLQKPYRASALAAKIGEALAATQGSGGMET